MAATPQRQWQVPFVDLKAQYSTIKEQVLDAIHEVIDSAHFVGGQTVERFEESFARYTGAKFSVGVSSGTAALELAMKASGIGLGDEVIVPANSFFATAEAVSNVGATPVFADINPTTFHLDPVSVESRITGRTRAVIPVHLYGRAMDLRRILELADRHDLLVIEDAAQAQGVGALEGLVGASGRLCCFSFYPGKNLGAYGDAGAITTSDPSLLEKLRMLRDHGSPAKYQHSVIGSNARLDGIQAAVLSVKLPHLDEWNRKRMTHARTYAAALADASIVIPEIPEEGEHNYHLFVIRTPDRQAMMNYLQLRGVSTGIHYPVPLHLTKAYQDLGYAGAGTCPESEKAAEEILSLPMYPELSLDQIQYVSQLIQEFRHANAA